MATTKGLSSARYLEFAYDLFHELPTKEINLVYVGGVTPDITRNFIAMTEDSLVRHEENYVVQRRVFNVMVECIQNISRHADILPSDPEDVRRGIVFVSHNDENYNVVTGNIIKKEKVQPLKDRLNNVNSMDKTQLTQAYKKQIQEGQISESGGAGLGFLDIAKKCGNKIDYRFLPLSDLEDYCFFMAIATVNRIPKSA